MAVAYSLFAKNVIAFEPNPATFEVLEKNSQHNPITPYNFACSTTEGDCEFHYSDPGLCNGGYASILNKGIGVTGHSLPLDIYTVNIIKFLKEYHPDDINNISGIGSGQVFVWGNGEDWEKGIYLFSSFITKFK